MSPCCVQVAECVADEFFEQGDKERNELHLEPTVSCSKFLGRKTQGTTLYLNIITLNSEAM